MSAPRLDEVLANVRPGRDGRLYLPPSRSGALAGRDGRIGRQVIRALLRARCAATAPNAPPYSFPLTEHCFAAVAHTLCTPVAIKRARAIIRRCIAHEILDRADEWPWPGKQMFVLTSRPIPPDVPADVVVADPRPQGLLERLRAAGLTRDAFLLGGRSTLDAFLELGAIDRLELPILLGDGVPFSLYGSPQRRLELEEHDAFPDGTIRRVYRVAG